MDALLEILSLLILTGPVWIVLAYSFIQWKRKRRGVVLPKSSDPDVVFFERFASGSSDKSWMTARGGASNCLMVIVTQTHLVTILPFPFTAFGAMSDLEHIIPIGDIAEAGAKDRLVEVDFCAADGSRRKLSLRLRDTGGFLRALQGSANGE